MFGQGFVEAFRKRDTFYEQTALALIFIIPKDSVVDDGLICNPATPVQVTMETKLAGRNA